MVFILSTWPTYGFLERASNLSGNPSRPNQSKSSRSIRKTTNPDPQSSKHQSEPVGSGKCSISEIEFVNRFWREPPPIKKKHYYMKRYRKKWILTTLIRSSLLIGERKSARNPHLLQCFFSWYNMYKLKVAKWSPSAIFGRFQDFRRRFRPLADRIREKSQEKCSSRRETSKKRVFRNTPVRPFWRPRKTLISSEAPKEITLAPAVIN